METKQKRKVEKRTVESIGKTHEFDYQREKKIYDYLCGTLRKKEQKKLEENEKFNTYAEWESHVRRKYENRPIEMLIEFSRYLNLQSRNTNPDYTYWSLVIPVLLTLFVTETLRVVANIREDIKVQNFMSENSIIGVVVLVALILLIALIIIIPVLYLLIKVVSPIWDTHTKKSMLEDYKEIIDRIIAEKSSECNEEYWENHTENNEE